MARLTSWGIGLEFSETEKRCGFNEERNSMEDSMKTTRQGKRKLPIYERNELRHCETLAGPSVLVGTPSTSSDC
jgi:hypothetical protein